MTLRIRNTVIQTRISYNCTIQRFLFYFSPFGTFNSYLLPICHFGYISITLGIQYLWNPESSRCLVYPVYESSSESDSQAVPDSAGATVYLLKKGEATEVVVPQRPLFSNTISTDSSYLTFPRLSEQANTLSQWHSIWYILWEGKISIVGLWQRTMVQKLHVQCDCKRNVLKLLGIVHLFSSSKMETREIRAYCWLRKDPLFLKSPAEKFRLFSSKFSCCTLGMLTPYMSPGLTFALLCDVQL